MKKQSAPGDQAWAGRLNLRSVIDHFDGHAFSTNQDVIGLFHDLRIQSEMVVPELHIFRGKGMTIRPLWPLLSKRSTEESDSISSLWRRLEQWLSGHPGIEPG